ncbi:MAG: DUF192 domain-containing protein [Chloroflexia bacterium]|nr:DUF192 domain-containing protein [Chloroflexia bacterium]
MTEEALLYNRTRGEVLASSLVYCDTFLSRGRGLTFRRTLPPDEAYVFVLDRESIVEATIHMFFVFFPIAVIWLDSDHCVVDKTLARPWRPYYAPKQPARYFVEGATTLLDGVQLGDRLDFARGVGTS